MPNTLIKIDNSNFPYRCLYSLLWSDWVCSLHVQTENCEAFSKTIQQQGTIQTNHPTLCMCIKILGHFIKCKMLMLMQITKDFIKKVG